MSLIANLLSLLAPAVCQTCGTPLVQGEKYICTSCLASIQPTNYHLQPANESPLRLRLPRKAPIAHFASLCHYVHHSVAAQLIRNGKYNNAPQLIAFLASQLSLHLHHTDVLTDIDLLIPIPMYWLKRLRRGYNQAQIIAQTLARDFSIPISSNTLRATRPHTSQTRQTATGRAANLRNSFALNPKAIAPWLATPTAQRSAPPPQAGSRGEAEAEQSPQVITGRHIALVDDILTTGATLSEAIATILPAQPRAITIITLAVTPP